MTIEIHDGELTSLIRKNSDKLVAIDFSNPGCPPCRAIRPFWESLPSKYPTVVFASVECQSCPGESQSYRIHATPTFVFVLKGSEVQRIEGANKNAIIDTIEKYKTSAFSGKAHTIGAPSQSNYFEQLLSSPPSQHNPPATQPNPLAAQHKPSYDPEVESQLLEMGFEKSLVSEALAHSDGTFDSCFAYIDRVQNGPSEEPAAPASPETPETPKSPTAPHAADEESAAILSEDLGPEGEAMKAKLVEMGYDVNLASAAIQVVGHDSVEKCIDAIQRMLRGENVAPPMSAEEKQAKLEELRSRIAAKKAAQNSIEARARQERERRKNVQEEAEARKKFEQMKRENDLKLAQKERQQERQERERVLAMIKAQRANQKKEENPKPVQHQQQNAAPPPPKREITECTLKLMMPDNSSHVLKFKPEETMADVERALKATHGGMPPRIAFESTWPRMMIGRESFGKTLKELDLCPRSQLFVKYL